MKIKHLLFISGLAAFIGLSAMPAKAEPRALISLHDGGELTWEQRVSLQASLRKRFGFTETRFLVDATPGEVAGAVKRFLEEPLEENDRRLVWVSGLDRRHAASVCPDADFQPIRPVAASLILAPACFGDALMMPQGARHFGVSTPAGRTTETRVGRIDAADAPWIAHVALPSDAARFVQGANTLIAEHLASGPGGALDAADLLHLLRARFRWNGSSFTPGLDVFEHGAPARALYPLALDTNREHSWLGRHGRRIEARSRALTLYDRPMLSAQPALVLERPDTIRLLRQSDDARLRYVAIDGKFFGWVRTDDLAF